MKKIAIYSLCMLLFCNTERISAQFPHDTAYTKADTLRGSNGDGRNWWDVMNYDLDVKFNIKDSTLEGSNKIGFKVLSNSPGKMQVDLQQPMMIDKVILWTSGSSKEITYTRDGNVFFMETGSLKAGPGYQLEVKYHGKPRAARRPPWDGGLSWRKDKNNEPWISISCQHLGASVWYPCKDYQGDEPETATLHITAPKDLVSISNGRQISNIENKDGTATSTWQVKNPVNSYCIIPYIGHYVHWGEKYDGEKGKLDLDYWVLEQNKTKSEKQFTDVAKTMKAFEHWFGPYPFYEDGYKLIDAPYLGMEHQSAVAYGNGYMNGYAGTDLSGSGWGMKFDFIIVHETAHEWWGNNITTRDIADMWVHESFANYSETLFLDYHFGKEAGNAYVRGTRSHILNDIPIIGPYGVNHEGSGDMYYKGGNMLHMIRQIINNDEKFRTILRGLNQTFYHQVINGSQVEEYFSKQSGKDFSKLFDQYLRTTKIPVLEWKTGKGKTSVRWTNVVKGFNMPVKILMPNKKYDFIYPTEEWKTVNVKEVKVDENFYVEERKA